MPESTVAHRPGRRALRPVALLLATALTVLAGATPVLGYEVTTAGWTGGTGPGATNSTTQPSGLTITATVGGPDLTISGVGDTLATSRGTAAVFSPNVPATTPSVRVAALTGTSSSRPCPEDGTCTDRGTLSIAFSRPVANPVLHVAGLGGFSTSADDRTAAAQSQHSSTYRLTGSTPGGATLSGPGAGATNLVVTGTGFRPANPSASTRCDTAQDVGAGTPAEAPAGCGSVTVNGTVTSLTFAVDVVNVATAGGGRQNPGSGDGVSIAVTTRQDYGDIPTSYDGTDPAYAVLSDLRLGSAVTEDNANVPNATVSPNSGTATGDDGVTLPPLRTTATAYAVPVTMTGVSGAAQLCGWVDVDRSGVLDPAERACAPVAAGQTAATLRFTDLRGIAAGPTYARFRLGYDAAANRSPRGPADSGEVEDYALSISLPPSPTAADDTARTAYRTAVVVDPLANDTPGEGTTLVPGSVRLIDRDGAAVTTLATAAGRYAVDTTTGAVTVTPVAGFTGAAPAVTYRVTDSLDRTAAAAIVVTVTRPTPPTANPDVASTPFGTAVTSTPTANDTAGQADDPLVPTSVRLVNGVGVLVTTLTNEAGSYTVDVTTGAVTFTPTAGFSGTAPAVGYSVADEIRQRVTSTYTVTVGAPAPPVANPDTATTAQNTAVTVRPAANDVPGPTGAAVVASGVRLLDGTGAAVTTRTIAGQGTYAVDPATGAVTFTPVASFTGRATPVRYRVADANGATAVATITVTVTAVTPTAVEDAATVAFGTAVTTPVLANDTAGSPDAPLVPSTVRLVTGAGALVTSLTTPAGTYTANADGTVTFTPAAGFTGAAPPVTYSVADANGTRVTAGYAVRVAAPAPPAAEPDTATTPQNTPVTVRPAGNDVPGSTGAAVVPASVRLLDGTGTAVTTLVTDQGTYTVDTATGAVTFAPVASFAGTATAVPYRVADANGATATSTIRITVTPVRPTADPDAVTTPFQTPATATVLANDAPGSADAPLVPSSVRLVDASGALVTRLVTAAGTYEAGADGTVTATPAAGFRGTAPAVTYSVADANGTRVTSTLTLTVGAPAAPVARPDTATTPQNTPVTVDPAADDTPGSTGAAIVPASVRLLDGSGAAVTSLAVAGQGTYTVDPATGTVTFTPVASFTGTATAVPYRVADTNGATADATVTVTVGSVVPTANPDTATTPFGTAVGTDVVADDTPGSPSAPLVPGSLRLVGPSGALVGTLSTAAGEYESRSDGTVGFTPASGFRGTADPVTYSVADTNGTRAQATYTVTVSPPAPPTATPDTATSPQNTDVTVHPVGNDVAGPTGAALLPASVRLLDPTGDPATTLTVAGEGTYTVSTATGAVTFDPLPAFTGVAAAVPYRVTDADGATATSTITVTVTAVTPAADPDEAGTPYGTPVTTAVLANDTPGSPAAPLVPSGLRLVTDAGALAGTVTTAAGRYVANADGTITFSPAAGYVGTAPAVTYSVADANGTRATTTYTVTVTPPSPPAADPDRARTPQNTPVTLHPAANDRPGPSGAAIVPASVRLLDRSGDPVTTLTVAGQGTYAVDSSTGAVTFTPVAGYAGTGTPVSYRVADANGATATSTLTVDVVAVTPAATPDTAVTHHGQPVTTAVLGNDTAGSAAAPLQPGSLRLVTDGGTLVTTVTVSQGTYTADPDGTITFAPAAGFTGTAAPQTYSVADANGTRATATWTVTVLGPPDANPDTASTPQNTPVTLTPLDNDAPSEPIPGEPYPPTLVPGATRLVDPDTGAPVTTLTLPGTGTYAVDTGTGRVVFTPVASFAGTTLVRYQLTDSLGNTARARLTVTVTGVTPVATGDTATTPYRTPVTTAVLANDTPGSAAAPLVPSTVRLRDPATDALVTTLTNPAGRFTADPDGTVTYTPATGFSGATPAVGYSVADVNGTRTDASYQVVVGTSPVAEPDVATALQGTPVTVPVLANDSTGINGNGVPGRLLPGSLRLVTAAGDPVTTLTVPGVGTYTANPDGTVTVTPVPAFTGTAPPVTYRITGSFGNTVASTLTVVVVPAGPDAVPDSATTPQDTDVTLSPAEDDRPGPTGAAIDPTSVRLLDPGGAAVTTLTVAGVGTYTVDPATGAVVFGPVPAFTGTTRPVPYRVADVNGVTADSTLTVTVTPVTPTAAADSAVTAVGVPVRVDVLANDTPGAPGVPLDPTSVVLLDPVTGGEVTTLTLAGVGTFAVHPSTGAVTFTPVAGHVGPVPTVDYRVADADGTVAQVGISVTVGPGPVARPDTPTTVQGRPVTFRPAANDAPGRGGAAIDPTSVRLLDPATGRPVVAVTLPGQGTATVDTAAGTVTFTPLPGFTGTTTPSLRYRVTDTAGAVASAGIQVRVTAAPPTANPDRDSTAQGVAVRIDPVANDDPGASGAPLDRSTLRLIDPVTGDPVTTVTVPGQGTFTATGTGLVTVTPVPTYTGPMHPVAYQVADANGTVVRSTITVTVGVLAPAPEDDTATTPGGTPVRTNVLANDGADPEAPLVRSSLRLVGPGGLVPTLGTPAGTYAVGRDGTIDFTPAAGFGGTAPPVTYSVANASGVRATATYTVTVGAPGRAAPDTATTTQGAPVTVRPLGNDTPGEDGAGTPGSFDPATLRLVDPVTGEPVTTLTLPGVGTYTVETGGAVTVTPLPGYTGTAPAVGYRVTDRFGATVDSTITVTVTAVTPTANPNTTTTTQDRTVTTDVVTDDTAGSPTVPLVPSSLRLVGPEGTLVDTLTTAAGTYTAGPDGTVTFDPVPTFTGPAPAVTYSVADANGTRATATYTVTVVADAPAAVGDKASTRPGQPVTVPVLRNDDGGSSGLAPATLRLVDPAGGSPVGAVTVVGVGRWTVDAGSITFTSAAGFIGTATVDYQVADHRGRVTRATVTVTVTPGPGTPGPGTGVPAPVPPAPGTPGPGTPGPGTPGPGTGVPAPVPPAPPPLGGPLPNTGAAVAGLAGTGLAALLAGAVLIGLARRRRAGAG